MIVGEPDAVLSGGLVVGCGAYWAVGLVWIGEDPISSSSLREHFLSKHLLQWRSWTEKIHQKEKYSGLPGWSAIKGFVIRFMIPQPISIDSLSVTLCRGQKGYESEERTGEERDLWSAFVTAHRQDDRSTCQVWRMRRRRADHRLILGNPTEMDVCEKHQIQGDNRIRGIKSSPRLT